MLLKKLLKQQNFLHVKGDILTMSEKVTTDSKKFGCEESSLKTDVGNC